MEEWEKELRAADVRSRTGPYVSVEGIHLHRAIEALTSARGWIRRMTEESRVLTCAFCGDAFPPGTPDSNSEALMAHVLVCTHHPMREVERELGSAKGRITHLEGLAVRVNPRLTGTIGEAYAARAYDDESRLAKARGGLWETAEWAAKAEQADGNEVYADGEGTCKAREELADQLRERGAVEGARVVRSGPGQPWVLEPPVEMTKSDEAHVVVEAAMAWRAAEHIQAKLPVADPRSAGLYDAMYAAKNRLRAVIDVLLEERKPPGMIGCLDVVHWLGETSQWPGCVKDSNRTQDCKVFDHDTHDFDAGSLTETARSAQQAEVDALLEEYAKGKAARDA